MESEAEKSAAVRLARTLVEPLYKDKKLPTGEPYLSHAEGVAQILRGFRNDTDLVVAAYLFCVPLVVQQSEEWITKSFDAHISDLVQELGRLNWLTRRTINDQYVRKELDPENMRRMLLAMCKDLRVVLLKLASRLQTLRWFASQGGETVPAAQAFGADTLALFAPLANRLGIWQIKWELEDLSLRYTKPREYHAIARDLDESRNERLTFMQNTVEAIKKLLQDHGIEGSVSGRPKHIYSIWKKMQRKHLRFDQLFDIRAIRIIVKTVEECYQTLSLVQEVFPVLSKEYDDYISNPKPNGYQSLHTVVTDKQGRPIEIQIRTQAMHDFAELGVAAHWRYKEAGNSLGASRADEQRVAWLRQILAWRDDWAEKQTQGQAIAADHVYCLTPQGRVVELPQGGTPVDFAYAVHTALGHRMRGAKVDNVMVPLNYQLKTGQTVEIIAGKEGQPSRDWLNPELGYAASSRTRNKVRQWFNAQLTAQQITEGRQRLDKELARLGKTALKLDALAKRLGFDSVDDLCISFAKEELSVSALQQAISPREKPSEPEETLHVVQESKKDAKSSVLVVGVDSLLTQLARCCYPVPPDEIVGFVTRGRGVTIHRADCPNIRKLSEEEHARLIEVSWGHQAQKATLFTAEILVVATEKPGLIKEISEVLVREKHRLIGMSSHVVKGDIHMTLKIETPGADSLKRLLALIREIKGVFVAKRQ